MFFYQFVYIATAYHDWIMGPDVDILPKLLLPLAAGGKGYMSIK